MRPDPNLVTYTRVNYAGRPIYQLGISFFKIALLISYLRLIRGTDHKVYRIVIWVSIVAVFLAHLGCTFTLIFACSPVRHLFKNKKITKDHKLTTLSQVSKSWNPLEDGTCLPPGPSFTAYAILTIISDVVVALLPLPVLWKLEIRLGKKLGLIGIFTLGLFTTICSIMRYMQIGRVTGDGNSTMLVLWGTIEFNVGVSINLHAVRSGAKYEIKNMVSSLPFLAPIFIRKAKAYRSKQSHSDEYNTPSGRSRSHGLRSEHYRLRDISHGKDAAVFTSRTTTKSHSGSEENILQGNNGITKSMTYTVQVDDEAGKPSSGNSSVSRDEHGVNHL